mmetsp:Transcript_40274/g.114273  ORF Transcript_40274/g.114273 Transcript_40274/m.114273 type:complete len:234 (+) Transcript_40274:263-964(+)
MSALLPMRRLQGPPRNLFQGHPRSAGPSTVGPRGHRAAPGGGRRRCGAEPLADGRPGVRLHQRRAHLGAAGVVVRDLAPHFLRQAVPILGIQHIGGARGALSLCHRAAQDLHERLDRTSHCLSATPRADGARTGRGRMLRLLATLVQLLAEGISFGKQFVEGRLALVTPGAMRRLSGSGALAPRLQSGIGGNGCIAAHGKDDCRCVVVGGWEAEPAAGRSRRPVASRCGSRRR